MALRFRRSMKICKGVNINFNKGSVGVSFGGRGFGYSINTKGRKTTHIGIPGTGLSYVNTSMPSNKIVDKEKLENINSQPSENPEKTKVEVTLKIEEDGSVSLYSLSGKKLTNPELINAIKNTPEYKAGEKQLIEERNLKEVKEYNENNADIININKLAPERIFTKNEYISELENLEQQKYEKKEYPEPMPTIEGVKEELMETAKEEIKSIAIWSLDKKRKEYVESNYENIYNTRLDYWNRQKKEFDEKEMEIEIKENEKYKEEYDAQRAYLQNIISGEEECVCSEIDEFLSSLETPLEFNVNYDYSQEKQKLYIDLDLPEIEDFPKQIAKQLANGNIKMKDKTQNELYLDYKKYVFGLAIFLSGHLYNISPNINEMLISAYTQRRDKIGDLVDNYIYSIRFNRSELSQHNLTNEEPFDLCMYFENRVNFNANNSMKSIEPFEE